MKLELELDEEIMERLRAEATHMSQTETVRLLGIKVDVTVVARVALLKGLELLKSHGLPEASPLASTSSSTAASSSTSNAPSVEPANGSESANEVEPVNGTYSIPEGWNAWSQSERIPGHHEPAHGYYDGHGWTRFYGVVGADGKGRETIAFYWCQEVEGQELEPYKGAVVQATPWGPGHILPAGFGEAGA